MMKTTTLAALCGAALMTGGCVREARIAMPSDLAASTEAIALTGMGGGTRGELRLGTSQGRFTRAAARSEGFVNRNEGGGSFGVEGPEVGGFLSGRCAYDEMELDAGVIIAPVDRFAYRCEFDSDGAPAGDLRLDEVPMRPGSLLSGRSRAGEARFESERLEVRAVHHAQGGGLPTGTPLGYAFFADGRQVGAVDLNGPNKTIFAPRTGQHRQAVLAASLALSILWDPGEG